LKFFALPLFIKQELQNTFFFSVFFFFLFFFPGANLAEVTETHGNATGHDSFKPRQERKIYKISAILLMEVYFNAGSITFIFLFEIKMKQICET